MRGNEIREGAGRQAAFPRPGAAPRAPTRTLLHRVRRPPQSLFYFPARLNDTPFI